MRSSSSARSLASLQVGQELPERVAVAERPEHAAAQVLEHREPAEDVGDLEAARQAEPVDLVRLQAVDALAVEQDLAAGRAEAAADEVEQGRLAGAVRADDRDALARRDREVGAADDLGLAEATCAGPSARSRMARVAHARLPARASASASISPWIAPHDAAKRRRTNSNARSRPARPRARRASSPPTCVSSVMPRKLQLRLERRAELQVVDQLDQRGGAGEHHQRRHGQRRVPAAAAGAASCSAATRRFIMIRLAMPPGAYITMNRKISPR